MSIKRAEHQRRPDVEQELAVLKDFQRTTVDCVHERLWHPDDPARRFLVADEVGLGKTLVARGVIAKAIDHLWDTVDRIDVVYICSNAQIARQNLPKLRVGGEASAPRRPADHAGHRARRPGRPQAQLRLFHARHILQLAQQRGKSRGAGAALPDGEDGRAHGSPRALDTLLPLLRSSRRLQEASANTTTRSSPPTSLGTSPSSLRAIGTRVAHFSRMSPTAWRSSDAPRG